MTDPVQSVPVWVLLAFAGWTLITLLATVGIYRWSRILTGRARISDWRADELQGSNWYRRAIRAHLNCVENLPVYGAIVLAMLAFDVQHRWLDYLAIAFIAGRICQTLTHLTFRQTDGVAAIRFLFFLVQILAMLAMTAIVAMQAWP